MHDATARRGGSWRNAAASTQRVRHQSAHRESAWAGVSAGYSAARCSLSWLAVPTNWGDLIPTASQGLVCFINTPSGAETGQGWASARVALRRSQMQTRTALAARAHHSSLSGGQRGQRDRRDWWVCPYVPQHARLDVRL